MPELALFRHGEELLRVALGDRTTIGRDPACDVSLPDPALSRVQAEIERRGGDFVLVDRSGRGTRVDAGAAGEAPLGDGAEISLGTWRALFRASPPGLDDATRVGGGTQLRDGAAPDDEVPERLRVRERGKDRLICLDGAAAITIGKDPANDVTLEDPYVSARHLRIERRGARWHVRDLGSTNGTFLAGARVVDAELVAGHPLQLGDCELALEGDAPRVRVAPAFEGMISADPGMRAVFELVERVAPSDVPVCILGETGVGKELVARAVHARSARPDAPFIPVNCSAIAETLIESELFGHEKGAFSGADRLRKGAFEEADGGTLFLDEIGELPAELQPKLLRALEQGEVKRVGASRPITVKVRVVAATHRDLRAAVRAKTFREDLYYRLCVVPISVPPLRQRRADVRQLAEAFLEAATPRGLRLRFSEEALQRLEDYDWPGNVRQLKNVVLRALLFRGEGTVVGARAISLEDTRASPASGGDDDTMWVRGLTLEDIEREAIRLSLRRHKGKRAAVVKELQIAKSTVMKRIGQWGLQHEGRPGGAPVEEDEAE
jgi:DNA-binding NtrC family response regulator/pSer/pThr/pTyr-binding forkhead associated (FHA) protein